MSETIRIETQSMWAEATLDSSVIYVIYGMIGEETGTTERLGHFLPDGVPYPTTHQELVSALQYVV